MKALFFILSFLISTQAWSAGSSCLSLIGSRSQSFNLPVIRLGHLPMQKRLVGSRGMDRSVWTFSRLGHLKSGELAWSRSVSTLNAVRYLEFPMPQEVLKEAEKKQTTQNMSTPFLDFVYKKFTDELVKREVFTQSFINDLKAEDRSRLEEDFTIWSAIKDGEIVATWGLYRHTSGEFSGQFEIIRTASSDSKEFSLEQMLPLISEYFNSILVDSGTILVRTDRVGARKFKQLGAKEVSSYDSGKKFSLEMPVELFLKKFPSPEILYGNQPLQLFTFMDENVIL